MGFKEMKGNYLELSFWNFDALYQLRINPAGILLILLHENTL